MESLDEIHARVLDEYRLAQRRVARAAVLSAIARADWLSLRIEDTPERILAYAIAYDAYVASRTERDVAESEFQDARAALQFWRLEYGVEQELMELEGERDVARDELDELRTTHRREAG